MMICPWADMEDNRLFIGRLAALHRTRSDYLSNTHDTFPKSHSQTITALILVLVLYKEGDHK